MFPFFRSLGILPECQDFSSIIENDPATTSANSPRTTECNRLRPMDRCTFTFLAWSQTWSSFSMATITYSPASPCLEVQRLERCRKRDYHWKLRWKNCWVSQPPPWRLRLVFLSSLSGEHGGCDVCIFFNFPFLFNTLVETFIIILWILCQIKLQLCLGFPDLISAPGSIPVTKEKYTLKISVRLQVTWNSAIRGFQIYCLFKCTYSRILHISHSQRRVSRMARIFKKGPLQLPWPIKTDVQQLHGYSANIHSKK